MLISNLEMDPALASDESALVSRAQSRDAAAFCELCRAHAGALLRQATALCGDAATAEDLVQETLLEAWKSIARYNGQCRLFTWLCSILLHRHRSLLRRRSPIPFSFLWTADRERAESALVDIPAAETGPDRSAEEGERAHELMRSLQRLPRKQREVLHLRFYAQETLEGIAAALSCSVGTVKSRLFHGLEKLRKMSSLDEHKTP